MKTEKQKQFLIQAAYYILIAVLLYGTFQYLVPVFLPFILGAIIVWALRRPAALFSEKSSLPVKAVSVAMLIIFYLLLFSLILLAGAQLISAVQTGIPKLPGFYTSHLLPAINALSDFLEQTIAKFDPAVVSAVENFFQQLTASLEEAISAIPGDLMQAVSNFVLGLPGFIIKLLLMVISSFYFMADYKRVVTFCTQHLPEKLRSKLGTVRSKLTGSMWIFTRAYTILLLVTFIELLVGFLIMKIPYAPAIAAAIAIFDLMPILGVGGILIPWIVIAAILGYVPMAVGVTILYVVIVVIRNTLEPRLIGKKIGLHPLATLISLFVGAQLFGIVGLFGLPVALSVFVQIRQSGKAPSQKLPSKKE